MLRARLRLASFKLKDETLTTRDATGGKDWVATDLSPPQVWRPCSGARHRFAMARNIGLGLQGRCSNIPPLRRDNLAVSDSANKQAPGRKGTTQWWRPSSLRLGKRWFRKRAPPSIGVENGNKAHKKDRSKREWCRQGAWTSFRRSDRRVRGMIGEPSHRDDMVEDGGLPSAILQHDKGSDREKLGQLIGVSALGRWCLSTRSPVAYRQPVL
ncbi:hypothetical protein FA13DRAFT_1709185 [Coprinellus micaceus]|uniref:Uncharacterized protein n=1 Tax=Coprinellus micaceus TaxID=71717 RepID=A0A4Y7TD97_COPMI|nr:hypothetical protein FA13DRAFT_1709185 [Coprinellus micaceus]